MLYLSRRLNQERKYREEAKGISSRVLRTWRIVVYQTYRTNSPHWGRGSQEDIFIPLFTKHTQSSPTMYQTLCQALAHFRGQNKDTCAPLGACVLLWGKGKQTLNLQLHNMLEDVWRSGKIKIRAMCQGQDADCNIKQDCLVWSH